jgi:hypothetical protein
VIAEAPQPKRPMLHTRPAFQAGLVAMVVGLAAQVWAHHAGVVFAFWDAQAHLDIARRVFDSVTPGLQMLGTVWLPVPHLLALPFTLIDPWWWNGVAGGIVGLVAYVTTVACVHDLLVRRTGAPRFAWIGTGFVLINPSLLFLQTTAMTEPVLLACLVASVNALDRWNDSGSRRPLIASACFAALAVGSRYDGWFYVLVATPLVGWLAFRGHRMAFAAIRGPRPDASDENFNTRNAAGMAKVWWRDALIFAAPSALMVAAWLGFNWIYFGDPLEFQRGVWSAQSQQAALAAQGAVPTAGHLLVSTWYYLGATALCAGALVTALGLLGALAVVRHLRHGSATVLLLLTALPFNILALWAQQSTIQLPWTHPAGLLNIRYGLMMLPGLAALALVGGLRTVTARPGWRKGMLLAGLATLVAQVALFAVRWPAQAGALREGLAIRDGDRRQQDASDWLAIHYDGGRVLVDEAINISPRTRIALRNRVYQWTWRLGPEALAAPELNVDWVVVDGHHDSGAVARAIAGRDEFRNRFDRAFDEGGLAIWRRR